MLSRAANLSESLRNNTKLIAMQRLAILSLTIALACLVSSCACELKLLDEYLDVSVQLGPPLSKYVSVLEKLDLKSATSEADIPKIMQKLSEEPIGEEQKFVSDTMGHLIALAEDRNECPRKMVVAFAMSVNAIGELKKEGGNKDVNLLESYLIENGRRRFAKCALSTIKDITKALSSRQAMETLKSVDETFRRGLSISRSYTLEEFYGRMKDYHPTKDKTSVGKLINDSVTVRGNDAAERTLNLYRVTCELFWYKFENFLDILNVARILNPNLDLFNGNIRMLALNERHRVCIELSKNSDAFLAQLQKAARWYHELVVDF